MTPNSNRAALLLRLNLPADVRWAGDIYWSDGKNRRLLAWISETFIARAHRRVSLTRCDPQLPRIWKAFNTFIARGGRGIDIRDIDLSLLADFEKG